MKQTSLAIDLGSRHTRKRVFLDGMEQVVPGTQLLALIEPHAPVAKTGRPPSALSDMSMQEALFDTPCTATSSALNNSQLLVAVEDFRVFPVHGLQGLSL